MHRPLFVLAIALLFSLFGCGSLTGGVRIDTKVELQEKNFRVVKTNVRGESSGFTLFGIIPIVPATSSEAMANLHDAAGMEGKATALVNVSHDRTQLYWVCPDSVDTLVRP